MGGPLRSEPRCGFRGLQEVQSISQKQICRGDRWYILIIILFYFFFSPFTAPQVWQLGVTPAGDAISDKFRVTVSPLA